MKNKVKSLISILLSLTILMVSVPAVSLFSFAEEIEAGDDLEEFSEDVTNLIRDAGLTTDENDLYVSAASDTDEADTSYEYQTARLIVKSKKKIDKLNAVAVADGYEDLHILQFATPEDAQKACEYYLTLDYVEYAQPDGIVEAADYEVVNETQSIEDIIAEKPDLEKPAIQVGIKALKEFLVSSGITFTRKIEVAVVDTGVESTHSLLKDRVEPTGKNFSSNGAANSSEDNNGHGTHVAGIVAVNSLSNVKIRPYKVLDGAGRGTDIQIVLGVEAAISDGVEVINMSLGRRGTNRALHDSVKKAVAKNIAVVVSSGNDFANLDNIKYSPASFPECITVIAHGANCTGNTFSNYGAVCDIAAPGVNIYSSYLRNTYRNMTGTSMAAPLVAAAVTYVILSYPGITPDEISETLKMHAIPEANASYSTAMCLYMEFITRSVDKLSAPIFSIESKEFDIPFMLTLSSSDENVTIYYTRSEFSEGYYEKYTEPIPIRNSTTVKAYAYRKGAVMSEFVSHTYSKLFPNEDSKYAIDENGTIIEYVGQDTELFVPEVIQGIQVKAIGEEAFRQNKTVEFIVLPESVKIIGEKAFAESEKLRQVRATGVETIDTSAFMLCESLESIEGNNIKNIGSYAFYGCPVLKYIDFSKAEKIESCAFESALSITSVVSDTLSDVSGTAFRESGIRIVDVPNMKKIDVSTFYGCELLEKVNAPLVTAINNDAFNGCSALIEINAENLESVGRYSFLNCSSLEEINFPKLKDFGGLGLETSDWGCFKNCESLKKVNLPSATVLTGSTFDGCSSLEEISLPKATVIPISLFRNCTALKKADLPSATEIYSRAFDGCTSLKEIELPSVKTVRTSAFYGNNIERLILPVVETVADLPSGAMVAIGSKARTIDNPNAFSSGSDITIYGTVNTKAYEWAETYKIPFKEINQNNAIHMNLPHEFDQDRETALEVGVMGFNRTYQWYGNSRADNTTGTEIEGAVDKTFNPVKYDEYPYYYCVVTSKDNSYPAVEIRTGVAKNIHTHIKVEIPRVEPTCVTTGLTAGTECSQCGRIITPQEEIQTIPHEYNGVVTAPTCTEEGYTTYTCNCGRNYIDDYVSAKGHTVREYGKVLEAPNCTEEGSKDSIDYCVACNCVLERKVITMPALGHTPGKAVEENLVTPTCEETGSKDIVICCSHCKEEISRETVTLEMLGHSDDDGDGYCDGCDKLLDVTVECDHSCHKGGISGFFWKITLFFSKLFGTNRVCECGVAHY